MPAAARACLAALALALAGCASTPGEDLLALTEVVRAMARESGERVEVARFSRRKIGDPLAGIWEPYIILPSKPRTEYRLVGTAEGVALEAKAEHSASGMVRRIRIDPRRHPVLEWRWQVASLIPEADARRAATDDAAARLITTTAATCSRTTGAPSARSPGTSSRSAS